MEELAYDLTARSLGRVMRVVLRLTALASSARPDERNLLLDLANELEDAVLAARDVVFGRPAGGVPATSVNCPASQPVEVALVDRAGVIVWTNTAWDSFCLANGGDPALAGAGRSYVALCDEADDRPSREVGCALRAATEGELPAPVRIVVPCSSPAHLRAFDVLIASRRDDEGGILGATVSLSEIR